MKYQLFGAAILNQKSKIATNCEDLKNGKFYNSFTQKFSSIKAAQKAATEILKSGEFTMVDCSKFAKSGSVEIFKRFARDLKN